MSDMDKRISRDALDAEFEMLERKLEQRLWEAAMAFEFLSEQCQDEPED